MRKIVQGLSKAGQRVCQLRGARGDRGRRSGRSQVRKRIVEQMAALSGVGHPVREDERERSRCRQLVAREGREHGGLVVPRKRGQRFGERRPDAPVGEGHARLGPQLPSEDEAARHPVGLAPAQQRHRADGQVIFLDQRGDHACLVERGQRA
jgi:hypothetical protein